MTAADRPGKLSQARQDAFRRRIIESRVPITGTIALTHRCNLRCVHCYLGDERFSSPEQGEPDTAFWCSVIDQTADAGCLNLLITGGEPLLRGDFAEIYSRAKSRGMLVTVFTNGTLLDDSHVKLFSELSPVMVEITLYGATREVYEHVTGVPGSYQRCLDGIEVLCRSGIKIGLKTMVLTINHHQVDLMREFSRVRGAEFRIDPALFPCRDGHVAPLQYRIPPDAAVSLEIEQAGFLRSAADFLLKMRDVPAEDRLYNCLAGLTGFHVGPDGVLLPCMMASSHGFDLRGGSFMNGWQGVVSHFRDQAAHEHSECNQCDKRFICGQCPAIFALETGSPHLKSDYLCRLGEERHRHIMELDKKEEGPDI